MKTLAFALTALSLLGIAACSSDVEPEDPPVAEQDEALSIGGGTTFGGQGSWCQCKLDCDNTYSDLLLRKLCKQKCASDPKCGNVTAARQ